MNKKRIGGRIYSIIKWVIIWGLAAFELFPLLQLLFNSFRPDIEIKKYPIGFPRTFTLANYMDTWKIGNYGRAFLNSFWVCFWTILITLTVIGLAGYALAKIEFKGRGAFTAYFLMAMAVPAFSHLIPTYYLFNKLGIQNTHLSLILIYSAAGIPFNLMLLRTFLLGIPRELEEAAKVDGCNELSTFLRITLPLSKSMFMTVALLIFLKSWNEFVVANTYVTEDSLRTVSTRFVKFTTEYNNNFGRIFTSGVISMAPVVILFLLLQKRFIEGLTSGGLKG